MTIPNHEELITDVELNHIREIVDRSPGGIIKSSEAGFQFLRKLGYTAYAMDNDLRMHAIHVVQKAIKEEVVFEIGEGFKAMLCSTKGRWLAE